MLVGDVLFFLQILSEIKERETRRGMKLQLGSHVDVVPALGVVALQFPFSGAEAVVATFAIVLLDEIPEAQLKIDVRSNRKDELWLKV